ncbi:MAG: hypothetical protein AAGF13_11325 [Pseudomonadota bacterium]
MTTLHDPKAVLLAGTLCVVATTALAIDLTKTETREIRGLVGPSQAQNISNKSIALTPLAEEGLANLSGRNLRTRFWTIEPNGIVPIHDHANRPASVATLTGEIYEYTNLYPERILHSVGSVTLEEGQVAHWWENEGPETVYLIAFDVVQPAVRDRITDVSAIPEAAYIDMPADRGATHDFLGAVDIGRHFEDGTGDGYVLSTYRVTIAPGGSFRDFTDAGEPVQVFVWQGDVTQHGSTGDVALASREGASLDHGATAWWENVGDVPAILYFGAVEAVGEIEGLSPKGVHPAKHDD